MKVSLTLNGQPTTWEAAPGEILLETLRRLGWYGTKRGCNTGDCGTCTVRVDGEAVNACQVFTASLEGQGLQTIEGLSSRTPEGDLLLHPVQERFVSEAAVQCGFCIPGMIMSTVALLEKNPSPTESEVKRALDGNLCRCTGYVKIFDAVRTASADLASSKSAAGSPAGLKEVAR